MFQNFKIALKFDKIELIIKCAVKILKFFYFAVDQKMLITTGTIIIVNWKIR